MQSPRILALIEGAMERKFLNENFYYVHVIPISNGSGWTIDALCNQVGSKYAVYGRDVDRVVVWLDKEKQPCSDAEFRRRIADELVSRGVDPVKICICIPDRMTENVILADERLIQTEFGVSDYRYAGDGSNGKHILRGLYRGRDGREYKEMFHGTRLLKSVNLREASTKTSCLQPFLNALNMPCWWLEK